MKNYPKPPLIEMMKSLYYLYSVGLIQLPHLEFDLESAYNVIKVEFTEDTMTVTETYSKERGYVKTSIPI